MDFGSKVITTRFLGIDGLWLTETVVDTWVVMAILIVMALIARAKFNKFTETPTTKTQNLIEAIIDTMDKFVEGNMGKKYKYFGNWFFGVFAFILLSNLIGLIGFRAPTADLATTAALALTTFFLIHFMGIYTAKGAYFKGYLEPLPLLLPLNIISELATPVSLSFRLFGNILGGTIIMGLIYTLPAYVKIGIPAVLHVYFDVFSGSLQTFIFVMLSMAFIKDKIPD